jgi:hypothetical protein
MLEDADFPGESLPDLFETADSFGDVLKVYGSSRTGSALDVGR